MPGHAKGERRKLGHLRHSTPPGGCLLEYHRVGCRVLPVRTDVQAEHVAGCVHHFAGSTQVRRDRTLWRQCGHHSHTGATAHRLGKSAARGAY
jgi:hypothetical protein